MERRHFLQLSMMASLISFKNNAIAQEAGAKPFIIKAGNDRRQEELNIMGGQFDCKVSSRDTNGALLMYDTVRHTKGGPALHVHYTQDELFYIIKGEFMVKVGDDTFNLKAGDFAFAPRKIPHTFAKISEDEGQMLVLFQPAGSMEDFFLQMSKFGKEIPKNQENVLKELWASHGMKVVGPPLKF
jgi:mannose-6-phosphate isomerase-like protein (cupin superfamily)